MTEKIIFCKSNNDPYGEFSNFYPCVLIVDGVEYSSVEHYYQSKKFKGTEFEEQVRMQSSPMKAKKLAYSEEAKKYFDVKWDEHKLVVMGRGLYHKFIIERFKNLLLSTGSSEIIEYSDKDYYWGRGRDGAGYNMMGKLLMELRERLKIEEERKNKFDFF